MKRSNRLPSPAIIAAMGALALSVGGNVTAAVLITSADIRDDTIRSVDIHDKTIRGVDIGDEAVRTAHVDNGTLTGADVANNSLTGADLNESTLALVPNADKLDGLDSGRLLRAASESRQDFVAGNLDLSNSAATKTTITSLTLPGPADYLIVATGIVFSDVAGDRAGIELARDGVGVAAFHNEIGLAAAFSPQNYAVNRLVRVAGTSSVISVRGWRSFGSGTALVFTNTLTATRVGFAIGAQPSAQPTSSATGPTGTR